MVGRGKGGDRGVGRGRPGNGAGTHRGGWNASFAASADIADSKGWQVNASQPHFSLNEEARNTERHHSWNSDLRLRHSRVTFVSAGPSKAEDLTQIPQEKLPGQSEDIQGFFQQESKHAVTEASESQPTSQAPAIVPEVALSNMSLSDVLNGNLKMQKIFDSTATVDLSEKGGEGEAIRQETSFTDTNGSYKPVHTGLPPPIVRRSPSPAISDSSEEIILFVGRKALQTPVDKNVISLQEPEQGKVIPSQGPPKSMEPSRNSVATIVDDPINSSINSGAPSECTHIYIESPTMGPTELSPAPDSRQGFDSAKRRTGHGRKRGRANRGKRAEEAEEEAEIIADYLGNIRDSDDLEGFAKNSALDRRDFGDVDADQWQDQDEVSAPDREFDSAEKGAEEWDSADLQDFGGLSTSSEALDSIERVLSKRDRTSGVQYLVVGEGSTIDGARWLPMGSLGVPGIKTQIRLFEEEQAEFERLLKGSDDSDDSLTNEATLALDIQEDSDDLENDRDIEERRKARMTDEQIARLLSKQEELGLGANDLMLFNGDDLVEDGMDDTQLDGSWGRRAPLRSQPRSTRKKRYGGSFSSATAFADVLDQDPYNGFDVMDQERPSLRKRPKGHRGKLTPQLSDSELEQSISMAWKNDRTKKKIRKQEREELRSQGLLGKKGKLDLAAKYAEGMSMAEVKNEIRDFLLSSMESLPLPPMGQKERKAVHEIASVFKLKSKSIGSGKSRFPVLYRTSRTIRYDEEALSAIEATLSSKRFLPRLGKGKKRGAPAGKARGGGFASAGVSYKDGEVVGATAPELGLENRGRAMLEKMGWSTGTALGALNNNRGIVQPVTQVVKTGKAGLG